MAGRRCRLEETGGGARDGRDGMRSVGNRPQRAVTRRRGARRSRGGAGEAERMEAEGPAKPSVLQRRPCRRRAGDTVARHHLGAARGRREGKGLRGGRGTVMAFCRKLSAYCGSWRPCRTQSTGRFPCRRRPGRSEVARPDASTLGGTEAGRVPRSTQGRRGRGQAVRGVGGRASNQPRKGRVQ